jgi:hypothetical protein
MGVKMADSVGWYALSVGFAGGDNLLRVWWWVQR